MWLVNIVAVFLPFPLFLPAPVCAIMFMLEVNIVESLGLGRQEVTISYYLELCKNSRSAPVKTPSQACVLYFWRNDIHNVWPRVPVYRQIFPPPCLLSLFIARMAQKFNLGLLLHEVNSFFSIKNMYIEHLQAGSFDSF